MKKFFDEQDAKSYISKEIQLTTSKKLCPVFATHCKGVACMSFFDGLIDKQDFESSPTEYTVYSPTCLSPLVNGVMEVREER